MCVCVCVCVSVCVCVCVCDNGEILMHFKGKNDVVCLVLCDACAGVCVTMAVCICVVHANVFLCWNI